MLNIVTMLKLPVYLDNNATTPVDARVLEAMLPFFTQHFGNAASRTHAYGWAAKEAVDIAREQVAALIEAEPTEIIFTSGATESCNLAIKGVFEAYAAKGNHIITASTEHKAVLDTCKHLEKLGAEVTCLPVDKFGLINLQQLEEAIQPTTILIAVMYANNELGAIQPIKQIANIAKSRGIVFFCDATQAVGKIPVNVVEDGIDLLALSAHKLYGPKGVGALYVRRKNPRIKIIAQVDGGGHEKNMRSGTLNVPGIVGLGKACEISQHEMPAEAIRIKQLRDTLEEAMLATGNAQVNGHRVQRLHNITNISFKYTDSESLMISLGKYLAVSSGSACTSASIEPSYVLKAIGLSDELAHGSLRFGIGRFTTMEEIDYAVEKLTNAISAARQATNITQ